MNLLHLGQISFVGVLILDCLVWARLGYSCFCLKDTDSDVFVE